MNFFTRYPLADIEHFGNHVSEFFDKLPDVPIVCISMLGDDYVDVIEKNRCSFFPAWMLLSRFDSKSKPTTMLLPAVAILEGV